MKIKCIAICLAGGSGSRMNSDIAKQYMLINDKPLIWYALTALEKSQIVDEIILVARPDDLEFMQKNIVEKYNFSKVAKIAAGGKERYLSVLNGLKQIQNSDCIIMIHDGARPFLTEQIIQDSYENAAVYSACVCGMVSKDTVKISDNDGFIKSTPERKDVWIIQTPQTFRGNIIKNSYEKLEEEYKAGKEIKVTDDASVVEMYSPVKAKLINASYKNIKITTPEDIKVAEAFLTEIN